MVRREAPLSLVADGSVFIGWYIWGIYASMVWGELLNLFWGVQLVVLNVGV